MKCLIGLSKSIVDPPGVDPDSTSPVRKRPVLPASTGGCGERARRTRNGLLAAALQLGILLLLSGCNGGQAGLADRILLWHTWDSAEEVALDGMLAAYQELSPGVEIISVAIPAEVLAARLERRNQSGLGPDLVLTDAATLYTLAEQGLVRNLSSVDLDLSPYLSAAVRMLADDERLLGLPFVAHTHVLFYNRDLTDTPPATIDELLAQLEAGQTFAQNPGFFDSFWGIGAFDGTFADGEQRLLFGQGGFTNWLDFLAGAQKLPGFLFDDDPQVLRSAFLQGDATYYVGDSAELPALADALGPDSLGVALLPAGPNGGAARPFLQLDAFAFSAVSSRAEFREALALARFLSGAENQRSLATADLGLVPINSRVRLTPSFPPHTLTVARQSRTAETISLVNRPIWADLSAGALGFFENYRQSARGLLPPRDVVAQAMRDFEATYGLTAPESAPADLCPERAGSATVWYARPPGELTALRELGAAFEAVCPGTTITITPVSDKNVAERFSAAAADGRAPDLLLASSRWLALLAEENLLLELTEELPPAYLQQFLPETVAALRYENRLYGVPESLDVVALLYNQAYVSDPPLDVEELVQNVNIDARLALPVGFFWAYWGMDPFGGFAFDSMTGTVLETNGLVAWLDVLQQSQYVPGIDLYFDYTEAEHRFAAREAAYLVARPGALPRLREAIGPEQLQVVPLPNGPYKPGSPMLQVQAAMINGAATPDNAATSLAFARFLNVPANQRQLLDSGGHVSASIVVDLSDYPLLDAFREQAKNAVRVVENRNFALMEGRGDELYRAVLIDGVEPAAAVDAFVADVHRATDVATQ